MSVFIYGSSWSEEVVADGHMNELGWCVATALSDEWRVIEKCIVLFVMVVVLSTLPPLYLAICLSIYLSIYPCTTTTRERYAIGYGWAMKMILL